MFGRDPKSFSTWIIFTGPFSGGQVHPPLLKKQNQWNGKQIRNHFFRERGMRELSLSINPQPRQGRHFLLLGILRLPRNAHKCNTLLYYPLVAHPKSQIVLSSLSEVSCHIWALVGAMISKISLFRMIVWFLGPWTRAAKGL